jgi:RHS repeat-associated protein
VFNARFGVPVQITDANGLVSTTALDAMGRPVRSVAPSVGSVRAAMPSVVSYERCGFNGIVCPGTAVMRVVNSQFGGSQSWAYVDRLGRTVKTATSLMEAAYAKTPAQLNEGTATVTEMAYNARGLIDLQFEPWRNGGNGNAYTRNYFDLIGRPVRKLQRFAKVDGDTVNQAVDNFRRTEYTYTGLKTDIEVCQVANLVTTCAAVVVLPGDPAKLSMSRSFDSAGKLLSTTDANAQTTKYFFDGAGNPLRIIDVMDLQINAQYNDFGYRTSVNDPDRGTWTFDYNGYGEVVKQTDARGMVTNIAYDGLGRATSKTWNEKTRASLNGNVSVDIAFSETSEFENGPSSNRYGTLKRVMRTGGTPNLEDYERWERVFTYDALQRGIATTTTTNVNNEPAVRMSTETRFDKHYGRVKQLVYPTSAIDSSIVSIYQAYNSLGMMVREGFWNDYVPNTTALPLAHLDSPAIRSAKAQDGRGLLISEHFGVSGASVDWRASQEFDSSGWLLAQCVNTSGTCSSAKPTATTNQPLDQRYRFDVYGNLVKQWHNGSWMQGTSVLNNAILGEETYSYDRLHRMTQNVRRNANNASTTTSYSYDAIGSLLSKSDYASAYSYLPNTHKVSSVALAAPLTGTATYVYDENGNVKQRTENTTLTTIQYDVMNLPRRMVKGFATADFYEGQGGRFLQRMVAGGVQRDTYSLDKTYELEITGTGTNVQKLERYYLTSGSLLTIAPPATATAPAVKKLNYLHQNRLGSTVSITEKILPADGKLGTNSVALVEHRGFDAFGKALDGQWGTTNKGMLNLGIGLGGFDPITNNSLINQGKRNQRGFTGHEHLDEFALIHMNGRAYDYNLGRFYGVDPFVQFPANSQSLNPYAYLMNNPLSGTDPTGYKSCDVKDAASCLTDGVKDGEVVKITDGEKTLGSVVAPDEKLGSGYSSSLNEDGKQWVADFKAANGAAPEQRGASLDPSKKVTKKRATTGDQVAASSGRQAIGVEPGAEDTMDNTFAKKGVAASGSVLTLLLCADAPFVCGSSTAGVGVGWLKYGEMKDDETVRQEGRDLIMFGVATAAEPIIVRAATAHAFRGRKTTDSEEVIGIRQNGSCGGCDPSFVNGQLFEHQVTTKSGLIDFVAETVINGNSLHLKDVAIFGQTGAALKNMSREVYSGLAQIKELARQQGFEKLVISGRRVETSSSAKPGHDVYLEWTLKE